MLFGILGDLGKGKTLLLTDLLIKEYQAGNKIYANYNLFNMDYTHIENPYDIKGIEKGFLGLDEFWLWADSRLSQKKTNKFISWIVARSRHFEIDIAYTTQHSAQLDIRLIRLTEIFFFPKLVSPFKCVVNAIDRRNRTEKTFSFNPLPAYFCYDHLEKTDIVGLEDYEELFN